MQTLLFLAMLIGVFWLCLWCAVPDAIRRRYWWPFDMRIVEPASPDESGATPAAEPAGNGWRARAARNLQQPLSESHRTEARRVRREPPASPSRGR